MANNGNRSRFGDRIKKIAWFRRKKRNIEYKNVPITVAKVLAAIPGMLYDNTDEKSETVTPNIIANKIDTNKQKKIRIINIKPVLKKELVQSRNAAFAKREHDIQKRKIIDEINIDKIKEKQELFFNQMIPVYNNPARIKAEKPVENLSLKQDERAKQLEKQIINIIKKDLIKTVSELEILYSELYLLSEVNGENKVLVECEEELSQIRKMLEQIDKLKEQYDYLRDNYDFEYLLEIEDKSLVDKIIELKDNFSNNEIKAVVNDYKLLDVYKYLYLKIDDLQDKTSKFEEEKKIEEEKLKKRDIDFEKLKKDVNYVDRAKDEYEQFIISQNEILKELDDKINNISSHEEVNYHIDGVNKLIKNTFKYVGLLMLNPLKGLIPSIAVSTLATRNMIKTLSKNVKVTEERKIVYEAVNYQDLINGVLDDFGRIDNLIDGALYDVVNLKRDYKEKFQNYHNDFSEYREIIAKINDLENQMISNKIKVEMMKKRAMEQRKENIKTLKLVDAYNSNSKNTMPSA